MAGMTRKDYQLFAETMKRARPNVQCSTSSSIFAISSRMEQWVHDVNAIAMMLAVLSGAFDVERFKCACGMTPEQRGESAKTTSWGLYYVNSGNRYSSTGYPVREDAEAIAFQVNCTNGVEGSHYVHVVARPFEVGSPEETHWPLSGQEKR